MRERSEDRILELFMVHVDISVGRDTCWLWEGAKDLDGYGCFSWPEKNIRKASQASYELFVGPRNGLYVLHDCPTGDNTACVNPRHLFLGTQRTNVQDMYNKGRYWNGGSIGILQRSSYLRSITTRIRALYSMGNHTKTELVLKFKLDRRVFDKIVECR